MNPAGMTNVTIGMMWGWHSLTPSEPFTQAQVDRPDVEKVLILLTDGLNTANRFTTNPTQIDNRTAAVCDNIKKANIKLSTVRVIEGNLSLLQSCATASYMSTTPRSRASSRRSSRRSPHRSPARGSRNSDAHEPEPAWLTRPHRNGSKKRQMPQQNFNGLAADWRKLRQSFNTGSHPCGALAS